MNAESFPNHSAETTTSPEKSLSFDDLIKVVSFAGDSANVAGGGQLLAESTVETPGSNTAEVISTAEDHELETTSSLEAFKRFFKTDLRIKRDLMGAAPKLTDEYNKSHRMKYVDRAYQDFKSLKSDFLQITNDFGFDSEPVENFFARGEEHFALSNYPVGVTRRVYKNEFSDMRPEFVEKVKKNFVGYYLYKNFDQITGEAKTVNELLHAYHSYIMNDENILQSIPLLAEKTNDAGYAINLRGDQSELSRTVFDALPDDLDVGETDVIGADDHVMMMVRDRGHALTINAEPDEKDANKIWIEYNIPKICNPPMIEALPGLDGWTENGARGRMLVSKSEIGPKLVDFIARVPTDDDMFKPGGLLYHPPTNSEGN